MYSPPSSLFSSGLTNKNLYAHISQHVPHAQLIWIYGTDLHRKQISPGMNTPHPLPQKKRKGKERKEKKKHIWNTNERHQVQTITSAYQYIYEYIRLFLFEKKCSS